MQIGDLPHFTISRIDTVDDEVRLRGSFNGTAGVRNGRLWLLADSESIIGDLVDFDPEKRTATFISPHTSVAEIPPATPLTWLDGYWQAYRVRRIADPSWEWIRVEFKSEDAIQFKQGKVYGWTKVGSALPSGSEYVGILSKAWDHEHCEICHGKIGLSGDRSGYVDGKNCWLCEQCHDKYATTHDISFTQSA